MLEAIANVGDYEAALRGDRAVDATRALGRAYAALHDVPPAGPPTEQRLEVEHLQRGATRSVSRRPTWTGQRPRSMRQDRCSRSPHGDPAPSNTMMRADGEVVLVDFEYAGARHRGDDLAGWHVLCPLAPALLDALHDGYGREIEGFDALSCGAPCRSSG